MEPIMNRDAVELLLAVIGGGALAETVRSFFLRKKMGADYADVISASAVRLLAPLEHRIEELEQEVARCKLDLVNAMEEVEHWKREAQGERKRFHEEREGDTEV
jgi:hypothetical protein